MSDFENRMQELLRHMLRPWNMPEDCRFAAVAFQELRHQSQLIILDEIWVVALLPFDLSGKDSVETALKEEVVFSVHGVFGQVVHYWPDELVAEAIVRVAELSGNFFTIKVSDGAARLRAHLILMEIPPGLIPATRFVETFERGRYSTGHSRPSVRNYVHLFETPNKFLLGPLTDGLPGSSHLWLLVR